VLQNDGGGNAGNEIWVPQRRAESDPDTPNLESLKIEIASREQMESIEELIKAYRSRGSI